MVKKMVSMVLALAMVLSLTAAMAFEPVAKEDVKVGMILIGPTDDGFSGAHYNGLKETCEALGMDFESQFLIKTNVAEDDANGIESAILDMIGEGCQIIFGNSYGYMDIMEAMAEEYPEVIFSHCSGWKSNDVNFNNYFGAIYQARYLAGIAAGLKTATGKIGYVGAVENNAEVNGGINAFALGVQSVNPEAEVIVKWLGSWGDPTLESQLAQALIDAGCDVIAQHCDSANPQIIAQENNAFGCGYNRDMTEFAPKAHLTAPVWHWSAVYTKEISDVMAGTWTPENIFMDMNDGLIDISPLTENVAQGTKEKIEEAANKIIAGEWDVFDGPITDNQGNLVNEGKPLEMGDIVSGIMTTLLVKGVTVQ